MRCPDPSSEKVKDRKPTHVGPILFRTGHHVLLVFLYMWERVERQPTRRGGPEQSSAPAVTLVLAVLAAAIAPSLRESEHAQAVSVASHEARRRAASAQEAQCVGPEKRRWAAVSLVYTTSPTCPASPARSTRGPDGDRENGTVRRVSRGRAGLRDGRTAARRGFPTPVSQSVGAASGALRVSRRSRPRATSKRQRARAARRRPCAVHAQR